jgi:hypothetical protein
MDQPELKKNRAICENGKQKRVLIGKITSFMLRLATTEFSSLGAY